jgi:hypothetical protein
MAFLTIDGDAYEVVTDGAAEGEDERMGQEVRAFDGTLRSTLRTPKRVWQFTLSPLTETAYQALRTAVGAGNQLACAGDALPTGGVTCSATITGAPYLQDASQTTDFLREPSVKLREV